MFLKPLWHFVILDITPRIMYNSAVAIIRGFNDESIEGRIAVMAEKKNILTYTGLKKYEDELHDLKVNKRTRRSHRRSKRRESRATCPRTLSMMQQKMSRETSRQRIEELEKLLKNAEVVVEDEIDLDKISIGCTR